MALERIMHRVNRLSTLQTLDAGYGAEIDIRSRGSQLILSHDPWSDGESLEPFLDTYARRHRDRLLILNTKEDGLEPRLLELLRQFQLTRYFFLDLTLPTLVRMTTREKEHRVAVRFSSYEPLEMVRKFEGLAEWVWVDCFEGQAPSVENVKVLRSLFKVCLVSPELQGKDASAIAAFKPLAMSADAVCTKFPERWA